MDDTKENENEVVDENDNQPLEIVCSMTKKEMIASINMISSRNHLPTYLVMMILNEIVLENKVALLNDMLSM